MKRILFTPAVAGQCIGCGEAVWETWEELAKFKGVNNLDEILLELNLKITGKIIF